MSENSYLYFAIAMKLIWKINTDARNCSADNIHTMRILENQPMQNVLLLLFINNNLSNKLKIQAYLLYDLFTQSGTQ